MTLSVRALADALVLRLNAQLPAGLWLTVDTPEGWGGIALFMNSDEGSWGGSGIANMDEAVDDSEVAWIVEAALDAIQDDVAHASRGMAWPTDRNRCGAAATTVGKSGSQRSLFRLRLAYFRSGH
jgi:hypothetical protein